MDKPGLLAELFRSSAKLLLRILFRVEVKGTLNPNDRMLIISNHQSYLDGILLGAFLPVWPTYLIHTTVVANPLFRWPLKLIRHALIDTAKPMAIKAMIQLIDSGEPVVIFPEGRITTSGSQMKIYDGPAFVAAKANCKVVPVILEGPVYTPLSKMKGDFPRKIFPKVRMTIHPPVEIAVADAPRARDRRRLASEEMRRVLQNATFFSRRKMTLIESVVEAAGTYGRKRGILEDINSLFDPASYQTILKGSLAIGRMLARRTSPGERVGILLPNANAAVYTLLGLTTIRRVPAMLNFTSGVLGLQSSCTAGQVKLIVTSRAFVERMKMQETLGRLTGVTIVYLEDLRKTLTVGDKLWLMLWALPFPLRAIQPARPEDAALLMFTSGSEGTPKGVLLSHDSILANIAQINAAYAFSCKDKFMSALPMFHAFGITAGVLLPLLKGCRTLLYVSPLHHRMVPEFTYDHDSTVLFTTNTFLKKYAESAHPYDFHAVRHLVVGAEKLTDEVRELCFEKFGVRPVEGYGATECSPVLAVNTPLANRKGTVGELLPGIEWKLETVAGVEAGGLLHVRGPNNMLGYLRAENAGTLEPPTSQFGDGWYNTGDIVSFQGGFLKIEGRLKRFAKVAGEMISLELVEKIAYAASPNGQHAASTRRDPARGDAIVLFTDQADLARDALRDAARGMGAAEIAIPRAVIKIDKIPFLPSGKKDYTALAAMASKEASKAL